MSIQGQIDRIKGNLDGAYSAISDLGGTLPGQQTSAHLEEAIRSIPSGSKPGTPLDPVQVYNSTRPADWLPMPEPQDNEMYLLFHIPDGVSSLLAFTVTCGGNYTVALGTVTDGAFAQYSASSIASGNKYEAELFADDYGNLTSNGMKQVMVKVSGTDILEWEPSAHSKKTSPANFSCWNIVEIVCKLPMGTKVKSGGYPSTKALKHLLYFTWLGENNVTSVSGMFENCNSLTAIPQLDTSSATNMNSMFPNCNSLTAIPQLDTSSATNMNSMFNGCYSLTAIPQLDTSSVTSMNYMFNGCNSLTAIPQLDTSSVTSMSNMFTGCYSLTAIPQLDTSSVTIMSNMFDSCYSLTSLALNPSVTGWAGQKISLSSCSLGHSAIVKLFNSLPTITSAKALTLTGNPGVLELIDAEKAIATGKNWTLTL